MSLFYVSIGGVTNPIEVYTGLNATRDYVGAMLGTGATKFLALDDDGAGRVLASVTRYLDRQPWQGVADAFGGTTLQLPRTGLVDSTGAALSDAAQLALVAAATGEMSALVAANPAVLTAADTGTNVRRADAGGGAGVEFFNPTSAKLGTATPLPQAVMQLLGAWLSTGTGSGGQGTAGGATSDFAACQQFDKTGAF